MTALLLVFGSSLMVIGITAKLFAKSNNYQRITNNQRGFTLIELLIAITIMGIAFGVIAVGASSVQRSTRDAQRKTDLQSIQQALQLFYADQQYFPDRLTLSSLTSLTNCTGGLPVTGCTVSKTYLSSPPKDPDNSTTPYKYYSAQSKTTSTACDFSVSTTTKCHYYYLCAKLEGTTGTSTNCGDATYNLVLTPL